MQRIALIGAGKLATQLALALQEKAGLEKLYVVNRNKKKAKDLAILTSSVYVEAINSLPLDASLYIIAVSDQAIPEIANQLAACLPADALVVHTSGATPSSVLKPYFERYGVFYPLQTFDRETTMDFSAIPVLVDAPLGSDLDLLRQLAAKLSGQVHVISDEQRAVLHVAAVFACNFVNHQYFLAEQLLKAEGLPFQLLKPLIHETARKVQRKAPADAQTGPAIRGDQATINRHLEFLQAFPDLARIYQLMTESIQQSKDPR